MYANSGANPIKNFSVLIYAMLVLSILSVFPNYLNNQSP